MCSAPINEHWARQMEGKRKQEVNGKRVDDNKGKQHPCVLFVSLTGFSECLHLLFDISFISLQLNSPPPPSPQHTTHRPQSLLLKIYLFNTGFWVLGSCTPQSIIGTNPPPPHHSPPPPLSSPPVTLQNLSPPWGSGIRSGSENYRITDDNNSKHNNLYSHLV